MEILLPLIGATDLDDWPGGIQQQFKAAVPLVEEILKQVGGPHLSPSPSPSSSSSPSPSPSPSPSHHLSPSPPQVKKEPGLEGQIVPRFLDKGDAVCLWESSGVSCVLFPTGATLPTAIDAAEKAKLMLVINPQWNEGGIESANLISDFGFGGRRVSERRASRRVLRPRLGPV